MIVKNLTKNTTLATDLKIATSLPDQFLGLLKIDNPRSLLFKTRFGIHTFFLKEPIDVVILDSKNMVVKTATVKPNSIFLWNTRYSSVLELPKGSIKTSKTSIGDHLEISSADSKLMS